MGAGRQRRAWSLKMTSWLTGNLSSSTIDKYALQYAHECNRTSAPNSDRWLQVCSAHVSTRLTERTSRARNVSVLWSSFPPHGETLRADSLPTGGRSLRRRRVVASPMVDCTAG